MANGLDGTYVYQQGERATTLGLDAERDGRPTATRMYLFRIQARARRGATKRVV